MQKKNTCKTLFSYDLIGHQSEFGNQSYPNQTENQSTAQQSYSGQEVLGTVLEHQDAEGGEGQDFDYYGHATTPVSDNRGIVIIKSLQ